MIRKGIRFIVSYKESSNKGITLINNNDRMLTVPKQIFNASNVYFANVVNLMKFMTLFYLLIFI